MATERRKTFRFPLQSEQRGAVLELRGRRFPVEVIDQSADGFSVRAPLDIEFTLDEPVGIEIWSGRCDALIVRAANHPEYRQLGLARTSDILATVRSRWLPAWLADRFRNESGKAGGKKSFWAFAAAAVLTLMATGWLLENTQGSPAAADRLAESASGADAAPGSQAAASPMAEAAAGRAASRGTAEPATSAGAADACRSAAPSVAPSAAPSADAQAAASSAAAIPAPAAGEDADSTPADVRAATSPKATLERLATLRSRKVAAELGLSEHQKLAISRLLKKVSREVYQARTRSGGKTRAVREARVGTVIVDAEARTMEILSPEQQARWRTE